MRKNFIFGTVIKGKERKMTDEMKNFFFLEFSIPFFEGDPKLFKIFGLDPYILVYTKKF